MPRLQDACVPLAVIYYVVLTAASGLVIDGAVGLLVGLWAVLRLPRAPRVALQASVLRVWMTTFIGIYELVAGGTIMLSGDAFRVRESALIVCNHRSWMDTVILYSLARQVGSHGDVKFFAKLSLIAFPVFGIAGALLDVVVFISREISNASGHLDRTFNKLTAYDRVRPFWMISYLEGTRRTRQKLKDAVAFAKQRDLVPLEHVLQPRTKGFVSSVRALRGTATAVYDVTLGYQETDDAERHMTPPFLRTMLSPSAEPRIVHVHQRRIPIDDIPVDEEELKKWTYQLYAEKDKLLSEFHRTGAFPGPPQVWHRMSIIYFVSCSLIFWSVFVALVVLCRAVLAARHT
jgi:lysocardiolipin and lysophospholipid acyltransferase